MKCLVTVAIPTKNSGELFKKVLDNVLNQKTSFIYEVLVVDSGSKDGTVEYIKKFGSIRLIQIKPSEFGHGKTRNLAISKAKGDYVALITDDAMPYNDQWLEELVRPFALDKKIAGVFGKHKAYDNASIVTKAKIDQHFMNFERYPAISFIEDKDRYENDIEYKSRLHFFSNNNSCVNKKIWKDLPLPDVNFAEDQAWAECFLKNGYKKAYAKNAIVYHSHDFGIIDTFRRSYDESAALFKIFGYRLCGSVFDLLINIPKSCLGDAILIIKSKHSLVKKLTECLKMPFLNSAKQLGYYCGSHYKFLNKWFNISLDKRKKDQ